MRSLVLRPEILSAQMSSLMYRQSSTKEYFPADSFPWMKFRYGFNMFRSPVKCNSYSLKEDVSMETLGNTKK